MPIVVAAEAALQQLDKKDLDFIKTMKNPSQTIKDVLQFVCMIMNPNPTDKRKNEFGKVDIDWWTASVKLLQN